MYSVGVDLDVRDAVRAGQHQTAHGSQFGAGAGISAGVKDHARFAGDDGTISFHASFEIEPAGVTRQPRRQFFFKGCHDAHRAAGLAGQQGDEGFDLRIQFRAKPTADAGGNDPYVALRHAHHVGNVGSNPIGELRVAVDRHLAGGVHYADGDTWFEVRLVDALR
jgi:hypothetical protein